jgi:HD-like signal output (HDOD) protein
LRNENFSGTQIARKISSDVVLVAAVVRLANSAMQNRNNTITSVEHAVIVIGQEGLRQLVATVAFRPIVDPKSGHFTRTLMPRIQDQSERCAVANRVLAEQLGIDPFQAFLCGLVQNVGLVLSLRMMDKIAKDQQQLGSAVFCASLAHNARLLACSIGREWHFPEAVIVAIGEQLGAQVSYSPLGRLLSMTDYFSKLRILVQHSRLADDPARFQGLPDSVQRCYLTLSALDANRRHAAPG